MRNNIDLETDTTLVRRAQNGERLALEMLISRHQAKIYRMIVAYMRDPSESHDVAQDVFLKVYQNIDRFEGRCGFYTWVHRIALNTIKSYLLAKKSVCSIDPHLELSILKDLHDPESLLEEDQAQAAVDQAVLGLSGVLRESLSLRVQEGLKYDEIAERMACPVGTVRSRLSRAKEEIEKTLGVRPQF